MGRATKTHGASQIQNCVFLFGIPFFGFAVFWTTMAEEFSSGDDVLTNIFPLFGIPFLVAGACMLLYPAWAYVDAISELRNS